MFFSYILYLGNRPTLKPLYTHLLFEMSTVCMFCISYFLYSGLCYCILFMFLFIHWFVLEWTDPPVCKGTSQMFRNIKQPVWRPTAEICHFTFCQHVDNVFLANTSSYVLAQTTGWQLSHALARLNLETFRLRASGVDDIFFDEAL